MTPQQIQLNNDLPQTIEFKSLKDTVNSLKNGQREIQNSMEEEKAYIRDEFDKGTKKFAKIEGDMENLKNEMNKGFDSINKSIINLKQDLKDDEIKKLTETLGAKRAFRNTVISGIIIAIATVILTAIFSNIPKVTISAKEQAKTYKEPAKEF